MKNLKRFLFPTLLATLLAACINDSGGSKGGKKPGEATLSITVERVGELRKGAAISLQALYLTLSAPGQESLFDTLPLEGAGRQSHTVTYGNLSSEVDWTLDAYTVDANGETVHTGATQFRVPSAGKRAVALNLEAQYSMLTARFSPIRDSVTRVELWVGGARRADSTFAKQTRVGDTIALAYDYVPASPLGTQNMLRLDVYGDYWGESNVLLYRGADTVPVYSGKDTSYVITLHWMQPIPPPFGEAEIEVVVGAQSATRIDGEIAAPELFAREWRLLGAKGFTETLAAEPSIAHAPTTGATYLAYRDFPHGGGHIFRHTGASWEEMARFTENGVGAIRVATTPNGDPVVAYEDRTDGGTALAVMRWNGASWDSLPGSRALAPVMGDALSMALDSSGHPVIAFRDGAKNNKLSVIRWTGTQWQALGLLGFTVPTHLGLSLALDPKGNPFLAYVDASTGKGSVMKWSGSWFRVLSELPPMESPSLAVDAFGYPVVAFQDYNRDFGVSVMRSNGNAWQYIGNPGAPISEGQGSTASLALSPAGYPIVAYRDEAGSLAVKRWSGNEWRNVVAPSLSAGSVELPWLTLDAKGFPMVGYTDLSVSGQATVLHLSP